MQKKLCIKQLFLALIVTLAGTLCTYYFYVSVNHQLTTQSYQKLKNIAEQASTRFQESINLSIHDLQGLQGFYSANKQNYSLDEFNQYTNVLNLEKRPYIQALSWVPLITHIQRKYFENIIKLQHGSFNINEFNTNRELILSSQKTYYTPVTYISPFEQNKIAHGLDLNSNTTRRSSLEYARDTGEMTATAKINLVQKKSTALGFLIIAPVYQPGIDVSTKPLRIQALKGYVTGAFIINNLMKSAQNQADIEDIELTLLDVSEGNNNLLYGKLHDKSAFSFNIDIPNRQWLLNISLKDSLQQNIEHPAIINWILIGGITISLLLGVLIYNLQMAIVKSYRISKLSEQLLIQNDELESTVKERTLSLAQKNEDLNLHNEELTTQRKIMSSLMKEYQIAKTSAETRSIDLIRSNKDLDEFAYVASHDLKAPLRGIDQLASWICEDIAEKNFTDVNNHIAMLRNRVHRLESLLDDLLAYSRANRSKINLVSIDSAQLIQELFTLISPPTGFNLTLTSQFPVFITANTPFEQVIRNLLSNAIKHHHLDEGNIHMSCIELDNFYQFSIEDDGPGIDPNYHNDIFMMFKTLKPRDEVEGSGMGLALIRKIVEHHQGKISVQSALGQGTTFVFTWPKKIIPETVF
jgi:signal transduction histidine kinase